ncbi:hypothetical protein [Sphingobium agri]|uniref:Uncharacterized protein n=1 Tax=Sphingobium agri TaxID=2933566 RepID=A0ABT0DWH4_9SPHN|nr:hypothetical protein [Sphingobium agri]MCK0531451.1 hypothetical protein [Sphingobium agri]
MIPTDTITGHPYVPSWRKNEDKAPRYFFRAASVIERAQMEAELSGQHAAGRVYPFEVIAAFRNGLLALLSDEPGIDTLLELVETEAKGETLADEDRQALIQARSVLAQHWPEYRELIAQQERRKEIAPIVVFRRFCTGWENVDAPWSLGKDRQIPEAVLAQIDPMEMMGAGNFGYGLLYGATDDRTFQQPSQSDADPSTSSSDMSRADGTSTANDGQKTPDSKSKRKSSQRSTSGS